MSVEMLSGGMAGKKYFYNYDEYEEQGKGPGTMLDEILADPDLPGVQELVIGAWGNCWEDNCQPLLDGFAAHADRFAHIQKLFVGDMDYEECEVSWIIQGNFGALWAALPGLRELTIKGSTDLALGEICHENLESLTIICGGLPSDVIQSLQNAKLPNLKKLLLYIGIEDYGFDGNLDTVKEFLEKAQLPSLTYLGIVDSEMQDDMAELVLGSKFMGQIDTLDLSNGTLTDKGGGLLCEKLPAWPNVKKLDVHYHYLSDEMMQKLQSLPMEVDVTEQNEVEVWRGETYMNAMLTE